MNDPTPEEVKRLISLVEYMGQFTQLKGRAGKEQKGIDQSKKGCPMSKSLSLSLQENWKSVTRGQTVY
jgi:hypothetical protein